MIMYLRNNGYKKGNQSNIPNVFAFTMIRNFLNDRRYKGLDVITIENKKGDITKFIL